MGSLFSCFCCCGCCECCESDKKLISGQKSATVVTQDLSNKDKPMDSEVTDDLKDINIKSVIIDENSDKISISSVISDDSVGDQTDKQLIEDKVLRDELHISVKVGDNNSYANVAKRQKSLSPEHYNQFGLVDNNSKEFNSIKQFMAKMNYTVIESIGSGNYAEVYSAWNNLKNRDVAIKVINLTKAGDSYCIKFLPREVKIVRKLRHKNIIKIYEQIRTANKMFMVMELAAKGTVAEWVKDNGAFTEFIARLLFKEILEGLDYMHSLKIAHRDLKLENILLTKTTVPKISDFSYAIIVDSMQPKSRTFCGSLPYFSPEILQQLPYNPLISDIWSLGVCLYIMVNNSLPFTLDDDKQMLECQLSRNWRFRKRVESNLSPILKTVITDLLEPDVNRRPTTGQLLKDKWVITNITPSSQTLLKVIE